MMNQSSATPASLDETGIDDAALLRAYLAGRDAACPQCGYNLRDLTGERCPECGEDLVLRLQLSEPKQAAALAGLIVLSAGAGLNGLLLVYAALHIVITGNFHDGIDRLLAVTTPGLLVLGISIALWLKCWRRIRRLDTTRRWALVTACAALCLVDLAIFTTVIK